MIVGVLCKNRKDSSVCALKCSPAHWIISEFHHHHHLDRRLLLESTACVPLCTSPSVPLPSCLAIDLYAILTLTVCLACYALRSHYEGPSAEELEEDAISDGGYEDLSQQDYGAQGLQLAS